MILKAGYKHIILVLMAICVQVLVTVAPSFAVSRQSNMSLGQARQILSIHSQSTLQDIEISHRRLRMKYHPDRVHTNPEANAEAFKLIDEAYRVVKANGSTQTSVPKIDALERLRANIILHPKEMDEMLLKSINSSNSKDSVFAENIISNIFDKVPNATKLLPKSTRAFLERNFDRSFNERLIFKIIKEKNITASCSKLF